MDRAALADFLRRHRDALQPGDVGLPSGARRRTSGLRREEVAQLSAMSVDSIARALRLSDDERDYLYRVAGHNPPDRSNPSEHVAAALLRVLDRLDDSPAMILSGLGETLAQNRMAVALFGDETRYSGLERSAVYRWFVSPETERARYPEADRPHHARSQVASLRVAFGAGGPESRAGELVRELQNRSAEFAALWLRHEVATRFEDHKTLVHPEIGPIELDCQALFTEDQSQALLVLTAPPGSPGFEKLRLLSVIGTEAFAGDAG
jgi:hypothetical protein